MVQFGSGESKASLKKGKLVTSKDFDIFTANLKAIPKGDLVDGDIIKPKIKELGRADIYPTVPKYSV